jgi:hypothetical protein
MLSTEVDGFEVPFSDPNHGNGKKTLRIVHFGLIVSNIVSVECGRVEEGR